jgi:DNA-binding GntR family transcriptional regulator
MAGRQIQGTKMNAFVSALPRTNLAEEAYRALRGILLEGRRFVPGGKISVEELARDMGVSRSPVWAAVARLEAEGVLRVQPRQGVFLIAFTPEKVREICEAREALEGMVGRLAASKANAEHERGMKESLAVQADCLDHGDFGGYRQAADQFHHSIQAAAANQEVDRLLERLQTQMLVLSSQLLQDVWVLRRAREGHARLLDAIRRRDPDAAEAQARAHIRELAEVMLAEREKVSGQES